MEREFQESGMPCHRSWDVPFGFRERQKLPSTEVADLRGEDGSKPLERCSPRQECSGMREGWDGVSLNI